MNTLFEKKCSACKKELPLIGFNNSKKEKDGKQYKCRMCQHEYRKAYRQTEVGKVNFKAEQDRYYKSGGRKQRVKKWASRKALCSKVYLAVKRGEIVRGLTCEECSSSNHIDAHHDDYSKPLDVRWLCRKCHNKWHKHNTAKNTDIERVMA